MRSLQWHLKTHWSPESDPPSLPVPLSREDLSWRMVRDHLLKGVRFRAPAPDLHLYLDVSRLGWGAHLLDCVMSRVWSKQKLLHIDLLEMKAMFLALQSFRRGHRSSCDRDVQQLNGCGLGQQAGRDGVPLPLLNGQSPSEGDRETQHPPQCEVSTRAVQCSGRSPQPSGSGHRDRVVSLPAGGDHSAARLGLPVAGLVREASTILFHRPGPPGGLRGCVSPSLGQPGHVRVSTLSAGRAGSGQSQKDTQSLHDPGRSSLAREGVVRGPSPSADPTTSRAALVGLAVAAAPLQPLPPRRPRAEPSHVATLQHILRKSGFSRRSAPEMSCFVRTSTSRLYQGQWMLFCGWCRGRVVAPVTTTIPLIVDFLVHLRRDKGLSVSAV